MTKLSVLSPNSNFPHNLKKAQLLMLGTHFRFLSMHKRAKMSDTVTLSIQVFSSQSNISTYIVNNYCANIAKFCQNRQQVQQISLDLTKYFFRIRNKYYANFTNYLISHEIYFTKISYLSIKILVNVTNYLILHQIYFTKISHLIFQILLNVTIFITTHFTKHSFDLKISKHRKIYRILH